MIPETSKFEIRETINNVPVKFTIYPAGARLGNHMHSLMSPAEAYTFFIVGDIDTTGMTDAEFFASPLAVFEGVSWTGFTTIDSHTLLLDSLRKEAKRDIANRLPYVSKLELELKAKDAQIASLDSRVHELRGMLCYAWGYLSQTDTPAYLVQSKKQVLNKLADAVRMGRLNPLPYYFDADDCPLLPAGDAGMFPAAHPRPTLDAEYAIWADSLPAASDDATDANDDPETCECGCELGEHGDAHPDCQCCPDCGHFPCKCKRDAEAEDDEFYEVDMFEDDWKGRLS